MVYWENTMPSTDTTSSGEITVESDAETEVVETEVEILEEETTEVTEVVDEDEKVRRRKARVFQRSRTREIQTIDLINSSNRDLRSLLKIAGISGDVYKFVMRLATEKDREMIRLRRKLLRSENALTAVEKNMLPRLRSKAQQAKYLQNAINSLKQQAKSMGKGKVAVEARPRFEVAHQNGNGG